MRPNRLLVTGATGFVGPWVLRHWREAHPDVEVWATSELPEPASVEAAAYRRVDLRSREDVGALVSECRPSLVVHLASLIGGGDLESYLAVNVVGTANLYRALIEHAPTAAVVQVGSAAAYGLVHAHELPITEDQPLRPVTEYALSKAAQEHLSVVTCLTRGLRIVRARVFNMLGPGQPAHLVPMTFVAQLLKVRDGLAGTVKAGDMSARRDFIDVRDAVDAMDVLLQRGEPGAAYNVASGKDISVKEVIDGVMEAAGVRAPVEVEAARLRLADVPVVRADVSKMRRQFGWQTRVPLQRSLEAMWRRAAGEGRTTAEDR
jgi:GDP-4-dehydro-6-deoxy-D-mannose reductase